VQDNAQLPRYAEGGEQNQRQGQQREALPVAKISYGEACIFKGASISGSRWRRPNKLSSWMTRTVLFSASLLESVLLRIRGDPARKRATLPADPAGVRQAVSASYSLR